LFRADVAPAEKHQLLDVIAGRIGTSQTGATWQRKALAAAEWRLMQTVRPRSDAAQLPLSRLHRTTCAQRPTPP
jgi:hypothetical protein